MVLRYERTLAPSEEVADIAAGSIGFDIEEVIWAHYLTETQADRLPGGSDVPPDWRDTGVVTDYIKMLFERHRNEQPKLSEQALKDDSRVKGRLRVPDISTYRGRFVPPRILQTPHGPIEDRGRCEYYEIKPNSDTGEDDGRAKLHDIADSYKRHSLSQFYIEGVIYPLKSPDFIPMKWSKSFEYLRRVFMRYNHISKADIDIQVTRDPDPRRSGLILYALRIRLEFDEETALEEARLRAAGLAFAMALCAAAGVLGLAFDFVASSAAAGLLAALEALMELTDVPEVPPPLPRFRVPTEPRTGPRGAPQDEPLPTEFPGSELEPDPAQEVPEDVEIPRRRRAIAEVVTGRGFAEPGKSFDIYCDEDYYQNIVIDPANALRFIGMAHVPLPRSPAIFGAAAAGSAYRQILMPGFAVAESLLAQIEGRFPNQVGAQLAKPIRQALRTVLQLPTAHEATIASHALSATALLAAYIDPALPAASRKSADRTHPDADRGAIVLPQSVLARWKGRDASVGATVRPKTASDVADALSGPADDPATRKMLIDVLLERETLKTALQKGPGLTLVIGTHVLYERTLGAPVTAENRLGSKASSVHISRLFALTALPKSKPPGPYSQIDPSGLSAVNSELRNLNGKYRYLGRMALKAH